ncbi:glycosyltransferase family 39 protein [Arenimonas composti]|uniref:Glycosyltransferase RgtA/B/C/D-like domain-containing protein n=1 Tax=Arenimonas composti TR7-09 = DSM 18010 TaxID=1121013 RepID=A0A091BE61_9GAMM|nr:glycosyltransferase family 39 protein [Arenimonas composti]KFN50933.1 hypothetical protein P873_04840 [Arenimonas composti TR7-09 = DSM 18010]
MTPSSVDASSPAVPAATRRLPGWLGWLLLVVALAAVVTGIGMRDPSPPDEPRFVLAARTMIETGQWLVPHRGSEIYAEKPPPFMWALALSYGVVRDWRVAFLLPSVLAALATLWLVFDLGRRLWSPRVGVYAAAALFACLQFGLQAKRAQIDMVLVALTTLAMWGLLRHLLRGPAWGALAVAGFAAGLGTVTKGVGFLPLLVLLPWLATSRFASPRVTAAAPVSRWRWGLLALGFLAGAAVWLGPLAVALLASNDPALPDYARHLLFRQTAVRYADSWHHVKPAWYYLEVIATMWLPLALLLPWLIVGWWQRLRGRERALWLLLGWVVLVLLFFSASPGKRGVYLFPALPALCLAAAPLLPALLERRGVQRVLAAWILLLSLLLGGLGAAGLAGAVPRLPEIVAERALDPATVASLLGWLLAMGAGGLLLGIVALARRRHAGPATLAFSAVLWFGMGLGIGPALDASGSARGLMSAVGARIGSDAELGLVAWREQQLLQADRAAVDFGFRRPWHEQWREAQSWVAGDPGRRWIFVLDEAMSPCADAAQAIPIGRANRRDWLLLPGTALRTGCVTPPLADETGEAGDPDGDDA